MRRAKMISVVVGAVVLGCGLLGAQGAQTGPQTGKASALVAVPNLQALLPGETDWTRATPGGKLVPISATCSYTFADAKYSKGDASINLTVGDSGSGAESLMALASLVMALPEDYSGQVSSRSIKRFTFNGEQAGEMWDSVSRNGEFTVVVHGRFVVKAEGSNLVSAQQLRAFVEKVDLKKLAVAK